MKRVNRMFFSAVAAFISTCVIAVTIMAVWYTAYWIGGYPSSVPVDAFNIVFVILFPVNYLIEMVTGEHE